MASYAAVEGLRPVVDEPSCVDAFGDWEYPMWKHRLDLARYTDIVAKSDVDCVIETGTHNGKSAEWFAQLPSVRRVITVDVRNVRPAVGYIKGGTPVFALPGSSTAAEVVHQVRGLIGDCTRVMVSLDSDHSRAHVLREIELYSPLVSPGCPLVIEDGVIPWLPPQVKAEHGVDLYDGTVLEAIGAAYNDLRLLAGFTRDEATEAAFKATMAPYGWWVKR
jgi:cephalosporin hydroxylase